MQASVGRVTRALTEMVDVYPTLAELAGLSLPTADPVPVQGKSLVPLLTATDRSAASVAAFYDNATARALSQFPRCANGIQYATLPLDDDDALVWEQYGEGQVPTEESPTATLPLWSLNDCDDVNRTAVGQGR